MTEGTQVKYNDMLAATTIEVNWVSKEEDKKTFKELSDGDELSFTKTSGTSSNLVFITDISHDEAGESFTAKFVSIATASKTVKQKSSTPLFIVHGFNIQPAEGLERVAKSQDYFKESGTYFPVPVLWPCTEIEGGIVSKLKAYFFEQEVTTAEVGVAFKAFVDDVANDTFPRKSLMMHSMGNHAVINASCGLGAPDVQFENIFMVGADVPFDVFAEKPAKYWRSNRDKIFGRKTEKAKNFLQMLEMDPVSGKPKGKIYVVSNYNDSNLKQSKFMNLETRLGRVGAGAYKPFFQRWVTGADADFSLVHKDLRDHIENEELTTVVTEAEIINHNYVYSFGDISHNYQLESYAVKFYSSKALSLTV